MAENEDNLPPKAQSIMGHVQVENTNNYFLHNFSLSKRAQLLENWINLIIYWGTKAECSPTLSSSVGEKNGHFDHVPYLGITKDFRF